MVQGRYPLEFDEDFLTKSRTPEEDKKYWYLRGVSVNQYYQKKDPRGYCRNVWQSASKQLIEIIHSILDCTQKISESEFNRSKILCHTYTLTITSDKLLEDMTELGLDIPRKERKFPEVPGRIQASYLCRAYLDCKNDQSADVTGLSIGGNNLVLQGLSKTLEKYVGVHQMPRNNVLRYGKKETFLIRNFVYEDWDFILQNGLYRKYNRLLFASPPKPNNSHVIESMKKLKYIKRLLEQGKGVVEISEIMEYTHPSNLISFFKRHMKGMTPGKYRRDIHS